MGVEMQHNAGRFHYATLALTELGKPPVFAGIAADPIDVEVIPNFTGEADRIDVWLIYADRRTAGAAMAVADELTARAKDVLAQAGFPASGLETLGVVVTSMPDIEERGGRFAFFR
jgi:hypothetical protein